MRKHVKVSNHLQQPSPLQQSLQPVTSVNEALGESITVQLTSCLPGLYMTKQVNMLLIKHYTEAIYLFCQNERFRGSEYSYVMVCYDESMFPTLE